MPSDYTKFAKAMKRKNPLCEICRRPHGHAYPGAAVHHIFQGNERHNTECDPRAVLVLCQPCHVESVHGYPLEWTKARQLSFVKRRRPGDYDREKLLIDIGFGARFITEAEVEQHLKGSE